MVLEEQKRYATAKNVLNGKTIEMGADETTEPALPLDRFELKFN